MAQPTLHTQRIVMVPLSSEHFEYEVELDSDPEVMRYLSGRARTRAEVATAHEMRLATARAVEGMGFWVGFLDDQFIGWWLLEAPGWVENNPLMGQAEIGYRLLRRYWRQGLASEGCRELIRHAFEDLHLARVGALTMAANAASRATMATIGLTYVRTFHEDDPDPHIEGSTLGAVEYAITRDEWHARK